MSIIRVTTNVLEDYEVVSNSVTPFNPFIVARFPSGPIGEWVKVQNVRELENIFGKIDASLPTAYGVKDYVTSYRDTYIYRVASNSAAIGQAKMTFQDSGDTIDVLDIKTRYKTEQLNNSVVQLIKETSLDQIYLKITTSTGSTRTIGVDFQVSTGTAADLSIALDKLVEHMNKQQNKFILTNLFKSKVEEDPLPDLSSPLETTVEKGHSGNDNAASSTAPNIDDQVVINSLQYLDAYESIIDAILAPEFNSTNVIEALSAKADEGDYMYICSPEITTLVGETPVQTAERYVSLVDSYQPCKSRVCYYPNVYYNIIDDNKVIQGKVEIPACVAMLRTYALTDDLGKWYAPEGISDANKRGLLTSAVGLKYQVPAEAAEILYNANNPVNYFQSISGIGIIALGNKVQYGEAKSMVFSKLHVVRMSKYLHREYNAIGLEHIGEPIDDFTYENMASQFRMLLDKVKSERGVEQYSVKCDRENNTEDMRRQGIIYTAVRIKYYNVAEIVENDLIFTNKEITNTEEGGML